ncbi:hypothetical protein QBC32DRAFT_67652 [Pseudoneurospora amorphoporcata]|uniref:Uncharacterized protein n=1 Tax=Pseudoneurospora amorphoporcata TaxID=241081 RepID=A0AAN6SCL4_9PEZI|nr:hypothetical protein QBC32DRAFT_67652 [Pseudoneurospora amorphoporcata]
MSFPVRGSLHTGERTSPYDFGIHEDYLTFTPPLLYFLSKTLEGLLNPYQPSTALPASNSNLLRLASPNTCSLTETEERMSIYNDRHRSDQVQAALAFLFVTLVCYAVRAEGKWNRSSLKGRWSYKLEWIAKYASEARTLAPIMVPPHGDYRNVLRSEATRLLARVALSACLCPIAEYLFCARETVSERFYSHTMQGNTDGESAHGALVVNGLFMVYLVFRYGTLPCLITALASGAIMFGQPPGSWDELVAQSALGVWDMWIERWIIAHEKENAAKEARYMAVMKHLEPEDWRDVFKYLPELRPDLR